MPPPMPPPPVTSRRGAVPAAPVDHRDRFADGQATSTERRQVTPITLISLFEYWRREHRGYGRYPENELWDAVEGYLDLLDASQSSGPDS